MSDITLRQSIQQEGGNFIQFLTNRYKIVTLTCVDTFNGEQKQISLRPQMKKKKMTNIVRQVLTELSHWSMLLEVDCY